jgi:hypothetical protein
LNKKNKKVVLITTGQPSCNPRIVKEAEAIFDAGHEVILLYCYFIDWAQEKDIALLKNVAWSYKLIGGSPLKNKLQYNFTRLRFKLTRILNKYLGNTFSIAERAQARAYDELLNEAKKIKADWYIGHNLGALSVAVKAATFNNAKVGFDFEDYHREESEDTEQYINNRIIFLENKYLEKLNYYSTASNLITSITKLNHAYFIGEVITLNNCFPLHQQPIFKEKNKADKKLTLFWFSQTIGLNRGLEAVIAALKIINNKAIHITLAGRVNNDFVNYIKNVAEGFIENIHFAGIIDPAELPAFAAQFDIGLALELPHPKNRNICLTNKVFTYLLAGNAIILSETEMQTAFNKEYSVGESFAINDINELVHIIKSYLQIDKLNMQKEYNYNLAKYNLNWENESKKLLTIIN